MAEARGSARPDSQLTPGRHGAHRAETDAGFLAAVRTRVFLVVYLAEVQSIIGDQFARVSLAVLVFDRTGSASATAITYALTYLPAIVGGLLLGSLGDRVPRRTVMIGCDLLRAGMFVGMAIPGVPLGWLMLMLAVAVAVGPAFTSAEVSYLAAELPAGVFRAGTGLRLISGQSAQVLGFAAGGVLVALLGPHATLLVNAATFLLSAALIGLLSSGRRRIGAEVADAAGAGRRAPLGARALLGRPNVRRLLGLSALAGLFIVPEGLAVPFGDEVGAGAVQTGLLFASLPLGGAIGVVFLVRTVTAPRRLVVAGAMAVACGLPLIVAVATGHWLVAAGCWFVSGFFAAYQVEVLSELMRTTPDSSRARLVGVGSSILLGAQGVGLVASGWLADCTSPSVAIAAAGAIGSILAALLMFVGPGGYSAWQSSTTRDAAIRL